MRVLQLEKFEYAQSVAAFRPTIYTSVIQGRDDAITFSRTAVDNNFFKLWREQMLVSRQWSVEAIRKKKMCVYVHYGTG